mmetsp:Transcript_34708/g.50853  ORF Transcript_34708/g.50853 Transcript_34708/m.50853 type:complete len:208 (+) Transcript_34708:344-967(+)
MMGCLLLTAFVSMCLHQVAGLTLTANTARPTTSTMPYKVTQMPFAKRIHKHPFPLLQLRQGSFLSSSNLPSFLAKSDDDDLIQESSEEEEEDERKKTALLNSCVGGIVMAGGIAGFVTKQSKASLIAGSSCGGLLLLSGWLVAQKKAAGYKLASAVSALLTYVMGKKYFKSGKYMPAGLVFTMAAITFVYNGLDALVADQESGGGTE